VVLPAAAAALSWPPAAAALLFLLPSLWAWTCRSSAGKQRVTSVACMAWTLFAGPPLGTQWKQVTAVPHAGRRAPGRPTSVLRAFPSGEYDAISLPESEESDGEDNHVDEASELFKELSEALTRALARLERQRKSLEDEKRRAAEAEALGHRARLILANLYRIEPQATEVTVEDWEGPGGPVTLRLDRQKYGSPQAECDALFTEARRLRRGSAVVAELIAQNEAQSTTITNAITTATAAADDAGALESLRASLAKNGIKALTFGPRVVTKTAVKTRSGPRPPYRTFTSPAGIRILVGRSARENEQLATRVAKDKDVWLHARGVPGAHVLVRPQAGQQPTDACPQVAADLAAFYSDLRDSAKGLITLAEPKHIIKPPNAPPGAVQLRKEIGTLMGYPSRVPEGAKAARAASGQGEAFEGPRARRLKKAREARAREKRKAAAKKTGK